LLGLSSDKTLDELHAAIDMEQITWPCWFDSGKAGPIATLQGVKAWATIFVVDPRGAIRAQDLRGPDLAKAVDDLLAEFGLTEETLPTQKPQPSGKSHRRR
jgi:hypothetical protein